MATLPRGPVVRDVVLSLLRAQVQSLVRELISHRLCRAAKQKQVTWQLWKADAPHPRTPVCGCCLLWLVIVCLVSDFSQLFLVKSVFSVVCGSPKSVSVSLVVGLCCSRVPWMPRAKAKQDKTLPGFADWLCRGTAPSFTSLFTTLSEFLPLLLCLKATRGEGSASSQVFYGAHIQPWVCELSSWFRRILASFEKPFPTHLVPLYLPSWPLPAQPFPSVYCSSLCYPLPQAAASNTCAFKCFWQ